jgi:hypothetical protein
MGYRGGKAKQGKGRQTSQKGEVSASLPFLITGGHNPTGVYKMNDEGKTVNRFVDRLLAKKDISKQVLALALINAALVCSIPGQRPRYRNSPRNL